MQNIQSWSILNPFLKDQPNAFDDQGDNTGYMAEYMAGLLWPRLPISSGNPSMIRADSVMWLMPALGLVKVDNDRVVCTGNNHAAHDYYGHGCHIVGYKPDEAFG